MDHDRAFELLPWLVNDTLAKPERAAVEEHVRDCLPCRIELKAQRSLGAVVRAQPTIHTSPARGFDRLLEQLDGGPAPRPSPRPVRASALPWPRRVVAGTAIATLAALVLVLVAWPQLMPEREPNGYATLADPPEAAADTGLRLDLVFAESLSAADRQRLLDELGAKVVSGPSAIGRYRVQLTSESSGEALARLLARLNADARVRFAGRALAEEPR
jgi:hypothetical protein